MTSSQGEGSKASPATSPFGPELVPIITGGSHGIGAGLVSEFRRERYAVVATSRSIEAVEEDDYLTLRGDIADDRTAGEVVEQALDRFGRIDCLVNDAGVFIGKPFTGLHARRLCHDHLGEPGRSTASSI